MGEIFASISWVFSILVNFKSDLPRDKMNCFWDLDNSFFASSTVLPWQHGRRQLGWYIIENSFQTSLNSSFCLLVQICQPHLCEERDGRAGVCRCLCPCGPGGWKIITLEAIHKWCQQRGGMGVANILTQKGRLCNFTTYMWIGPKCWPEVIILQLPDFWIGEL